ncbi:hypothetical protein M885DRAFT_508325 [Pelagophyceae sp. CCMP2097]|nr:hypothetical protein M885DRAFT_508325 [Pelagophyceae sp. CCMP2097]
MFKLPVTGSKARAAAAAVAQEVKAAALKASEDAAAADAAAHPLDDVFADDPVNEFFADEDDGAAAPAEDQAAVDPHADFHVDSSCAYPSMQSDPVDDAREWGTKRQPGSAVGASHRAQPNAAFVTGLPLQVSDVQVAKFFEAAGVVREVYRVKSDGRFNGCAVVTFGSPAAAVLAVAKSGEKLGNAVVHIRPSHRRLKSQRGDDDDDGRKAARQDGANNRTYPHQIPEGFVELDFKKRKMMYPGDHALGRQI